VGRMTPRLGEGRRAVPCMPRFRVADPGLRDNSPERRLLVATLTQACAYAVGPSRYAAAELAWLRSPAIHAMPMSAEWICQQLGYDRARLYAQVCSARLRGERLQVSMRHAGTRHQVRGHQRAA
jgi:hypothetical protein